MSGKRILNNISYNYAATFVNLAASIVIVPILLSSIGKESYGLFVLFVTYSATGIYSILDFGLRGSLEKYIAEDNALGNEEGVLKNLNALFSVLLMAALISILLNIIIYTFFLDKWLASPSEDALRYKYLFLIFTAFSVVFFSRLGLETFLYGLQRIDDASKVTIYQKILWLLGTYLLFSLLTERGFEAYILFYLLLETFAVLSLLRICKNKFPGFRISYRLFDIEALKRSKGLGFDFFITRLNGVAFSQSPRIILGAYDVKVLAEFDIIYKFSSLMIVAMGTINRAIFPLTSAYHAGGNHQKIRNVFVLSTVFSTTIASVIAIIVMIFPDKLLYLWLRSTAYHDLAGVLAFSVLWVFPVAIINAGSVMLGAINQIRRIVGWTIIGTVISVISAPWLVKIWGLYGMFIALFIASLFPVPAYIAGIKENLGISYRTIIFSVVSRVIIIISLTTYLAISSRYLLPIDSLVNLTSLGIILLALSTSVLIVLLSKEERLLIFNIVGINKKIKLKE